jgi:hypothetical protein
VGLAIGLWDWRPGCGLGERLWDWRPGCEIDDRALGWGTGLWDWRLNSSLPIGTDFYETDFLLRKEKTPKTEEEEAVPDIQNSCLCWCLPYFHLMLGGGGDELPESFSIINSVPAIF